MLLIIDHYDSFSAMIADYCRAIMAEYCMLKTDQINSATLAKINPSHIIIGPGPGHPRDQELIATKELIKQAIEHKIPLLGICLGHQLIAEVFGAKIVTAEQICHGIISKITHNNGGIFNNLPASFEVTRYHSLLIENRSMIDKEIKISAETSDGEIMAIHHQKLAIFGVQFHPESISTQNGKQLLANFLKVS
ncbi:MAG: aminodeoxychorismate/anthranilate synthase component II [Burkholderiales bacterium]|jgi:anthranilate synthase/aminodeoxychorismate synthase-like glutamine amidotransferase|nr:aminodeoxychorismate/anthranilate synthase component II [Burkholderiales bacterium]